MSNIRTGVIMVAGLAIGIVAPVLVGQWIFDGVFGVLDPDSRDFWQNLVTLAIAAILTLIVGEVAFGIVVGIFFDQFSSLLSKGVEEAVLHDMTLKYHRASTYLKELECADTSVYMPFKRLT
jgi:hypothetical protein